MELSKDDVKMTKGLAILAMLCLHLFCRRGTDIKISYFLWFSDDTPLLYYLGFFCECCVAIYSFCAGYAQYLLAEKAPTIKEYVKQSLWRLLKFAINCWTILTLFYILAFIIGRQNVFGEGVGKLLLNFTLTQKDFNGAWWYVFTYIILTIISPVLYWICKKSNSILCVVTVIIIGVSWWVVLRMGVLEISSWSMIQVSNIVKSDVLAAYMIGMIFRKERYISLIRKKVIETNNWIIFMLSGLIFVVVSLIQKAVVMPFVGIIVVIIFSILKKGEKTKKLFLFLGMHSTNIWLLHMFFYAESSLFPDLVFGVKYPIAVLGLLLFLSIMSSYVVMGGSNLIYKYIDKAKR